MALLIIDLYDLKCGAIYESLQPDVQALVVGEKDDRSKRIYKPKPQMSYARMLAIAEIQAATKVRLQTEHAAFDPFALKKSIEAKLKKFFNALSNLDRGVNKNLTDLHRRQHLVASQHAACQ